MATSVRAIWRTDVVLEGAVGWVRVTNLGSGETLYFDWSAESEACRSEGQARAQAALWIANRGGAR